MCAAARLISALINTKSKYLYINKYRQQPNSNSNRLICFIMRTVFILEERFFSLHATLSRLLMLEGCNYTFWWEPIPKVLGQNSIY